MMLTHTMLADGAIAKYSAVSIGRFDNTVQPAYWPDPSIVSIVIGLALNDGGDGSEIEVCIMGPVTSNLFNFERGRPIYIGVGGYLTQKIPDRSIYRIGKAVAVNTIMVLPSEVFMLRLM